MQTPCRALGYLVGTLAVSGSGVRPLGGIRGVAASRTLLSGLQSLTSLHILHLLLTPLPPPAAFQELFFAPTRSSRPPF